MQTSLFNKGSVYAKQEPYWITPSEVFDPIASAWDEAGMPLLTDVCTTREARKCPKFFTPEDDCFEQDWLGDCWMNPPYGDDIVFFLEKATLEVEAGRARVVCLLPDNNDAPWWRAYCERWPFLFWPERIHFIHPEGGRGMSPANGNMLVAMGYEPESLPDIVVPTRKQGRVVPPWFTKARKA